MVGDWIDVDDRRRKMSIERRRGRLADREDFEAAAAAREDSLDCDLERHIAAVFPEARDRARLARTCMNLPH